MSEQLEIRKEGALQQAFGAFSPAVLVEQVQLIQQAMRSCMEDGTHYGVIPGTERRDKSGKDVSRPTLYKPGAEKLGLMFRLAPKYDVEVIDAGGGHREYRVACCLTSIQTGAFIGEGVGTCSTMEAKYRWRNTDAFEVTDLPIPRDSKERKDEYRRLGFGMRKVGADWKWVKFTGPGERTENPDLADCYNTCLKMAKKRAHVDAILTATAASDIFTQDLEDAAPEEAAPVSVPKKTPRPVEVAPEPPPAPSDVPHVNEEAAQLQARAQIQVQQEVERTTTVWKNWLELVGDDRDKLNEGLPELADITNPQAKSDVKDLITAHAKAQDWIFDKQAALYKARVVAPPLAPVPA